MDIKEDGEIFEVPDAHGSTILARRTVSKNGDVLTCAPAFKHIKTVIDNLDRLQLRDDDVILVSYATSGTFIFLPDNVSARPAFLKGGVDIILRGALGEKMLRNTGVRLVNLASSFFYTVVVLSCKIQLVPVDCLIQARIGCTRCYVCSYVTTSNPALTRLGICWKLYPILMTSTTKKILEY